MKIKIRKKDLKILPGMKMKIQTVRETGSVLICAETVRSSDKVRYEVPCEIEQDGDVLLKSESIFSRLGDEIAICNTTKTVSITDGKVTFKEPCVTGEDVFFPEPGPDHALALS